MTHGKTSFTPGTPLPDHWFHILLALADDNRHGLGIIQEVTAQTDGHIQIWPGMLYLALKRMTDDGLVAETEPPVGFVAGGGRPRFYRITPLGRRAIRRAGAVRANSGRPLRQSFGFSLCLAVAGRLGGVWAVYDRMQRGGCPALRSAGAPPTPGGAD